MSQRGDFATCPKCGRCLTGGTTPTGPNTSTGQCRKHGSVSVRWVGLRGTRGAPAQWLDDLPPRR